MSLCVRLGIVRRGGERTTLPPHPPHRAWAPARANVFDPASGWRLGVCRLRVCSVRMRSRSSSLFDRTPGAGLRSDIVGAGADEAVVVVLLDDVGRPAGDARGG